MFKWLSNLFLVKEIRSKTGELHFQRWVLFALPFLRIYLHKICLPDYDEHMHDHPWNFISIILKGGYLEKFSNGPNYDIVSYNHNNPGTIVKRNREQVHKIEKLFKISSWSLVLAWGEYQIWGYRIGSEWVDHILYRLMKYGKENRSNG